MLPRTVTQKKPIKQTKTPLMPLEPISPSSFVRQPRANNIWTNGAYRMDPPADRHSARTTHPAHGPKAHGWYW